jgi:transcriptional regulator with XRE-family HTH domain
VSESKLREATCAAVASLLRETREQRGLSMTQLAELAGLSRAMISFTERELRNPTLDTLLRICAALKVDLADIIRKAAKGSSRSR